MMGEVIRRRFSRLNSDEEEESSKPRRFAYPPNLVVVDGGKGQLNEAVDAMHHLGVEGVAVVSLAKRMEEVFVPGTPDPVIIPRGSEALYLLQQIRDEAHRFALAYHRLRRGKRMTQSALDGIPGLGEARRKSLLKRFGSVKRVREASRDELEAVKGMPKAVAGAVYEALHTEQASTADTSTPGEREAS